MEWETEDNAGYYRLDDQGAIGSGRKLRYRVGTEDEARETELWKFSRPDSGHDALAPAVVFEVEQDAIVLKRHPLYCYLPTAGESHLPVILHAPFKLTGNRESIMAHDSHNLRMIDELASLLAAAVSSVLLSRQSKRYERLAQSSAEAVGAHTPAVAVEEPGLLPDGTEIVSSRVFPEERIRAYRQSHPRAGH